MQEELENFFNAHEKSIQEKTKLLVDFQDESIESNSLVEFSKLEITPKFKSSKVEPKIAVKANVLNLRNKNKNNLF